MAHRSNTVYFGQPDASGQDGMGGGPVRVPVMYLGIPREGGGWGGSLAKSWGGSPMYLFCCIPVPVPKTSWYFVLKNLLNISKEVFFLSFYLFGWSRSHLYIFSSGSTSKKAGSVTLSFTHIFKNSMISGGYFFQSAFSP